MSWRVVSLASFYRIYGWFPLLLPVEHVNHSVSLLQMDRAQFTVFMKTAQSSQQVKVRRPRWSLSTSFWGSGIVILLVSCLTFFGLKKSFWAELEILVGILSFFMFTYFFLLLYRGVHFDKREQDLMPWRAKLTDWLDASPSVNTGETFTEGGAEAGSLGLVVGFLRYLLVSIVLTVLLAAVLWLSLNVFVTAVVLLGTPLRTLVLCGGAAQGRWLLSLRGSPVGCYLPRLLRTPPRAPGEFL
jgi:hypothetical protein